MEGTKQPGGRRTGVRRASGMERRRRPTLPRSRDRSTIGAVRLNDRVRNGNGCGPDARVASKAEPTAESCQPKEQERTRKNKKEQERTRKNKKEQHGDEGKSVGMVRHNI